MLKKYLTQRKKNKYSMFAYSEQKAEGNLDNSQKIESLKDNSDFNLSETELFSKFHSRPEGHNSSEVRVMTEKYGANEIKASDEKNAVILLLSKFTNPLVIMLLIVAIFAILFGQKASAGIIIVMAFMGAILSFIQEHQASQNAKKLQEMVKITAEIFRDGKITEVPLREIVPGDIINLSAGKMIPADLKIIESTDLFINQSVLNGESFPAQKMAENAPTLATTTDSIFNHPNLAFMGSSVASGEGKGLVIYTGRATEFGKLAKELVKAKEETAFDKGIKGFVWLMIRLIVILTLSIFLINAFSKGNYIESLLFALAVAVGLMPEMLPAIITVNLSKGAILMARKKVIVKELDSIQNFGAMDILCTDKTGTLTLNDISLVEYCDFSGIKNEEVLKYAYYTSYFQTGLESVLETAVKNYKKFPIENIKKINEIPFDFDRRVMSVVINDHQLKIITKGAPEAVLEKSKFYTKGSEKLPLEGDVLKKIKEKYEALSRDGFRVLAIATKEVSPKPHFSHADENEMNFLGFVAFLDPPKPDASASIKQLNDLGIDLKILSGDNAIVTEKVCRGVGLAINGLLTGAEIDELNDDELKNRVEHVNVFARLSPMQKERVVGSLQKSNHIIGYLGDGINDAPAIKKADVGISVNNATDIAKETANLILLEKDLTILGDCVKEGRRTFANVIKYIKMGASSNFGNMLSMTVASIFLPFLPMLPAQILLNNFMYDVSQLAIPTDRVDENYLQKPRPWHINFIKEFIIYIGPISSIFDFVTFLVMWYFFHANESLFQTGWFVESLTTQVLVVHIIRTNQIPFIQSRPSRTLLLTTLSIVILGFVLPYIPSVAHLLGFQPLPAVFFLILLGIAIAYLFLVQIAKNIFSKKFGFE